MKSFLVYLSLGLVGVCAWSIHGTSALSAEGGNEPASAGVPPAPGMGSGGSGMEVLTRGPIHEAFAQPVNTGPARPLMVSKKPPEAIEEVPPDRKPADENALWIGGYWSWDDDRKDFLWVSGVWRVPPPGHRWLAGYWQEKGEGYQWTPGVWLPDETQEVSYYPEPPASLEEGPTSEAPSPDYAWIPGCWRWNGERYAWQPGYWASVEADWMWVPASYCWTPHGWVFVDGYWDYPLHRRGLIFAPVHLSHSLLGRTGFSFSPSVVIDPGILTFYLFARPAYGHYYFGDYYAAEYDGLGIYPWFSVRAYANYRYDPLFSYYRWSYRGEPQWADHLRQWHAHYRANPEERPAHDLLAQDRLMARVGDRADRAFLTIGHTLRQWSEKADVSVPLVSVSQQQRTLFRDTGRLMRDLALQRRQMEAVGAAKTTALTAPANLALPKVAGELTQRLRAGGLTGGSPLIPQGATGALPSGATGATGIVPRTTAKPVLPQQVVPGLVPGNAPSEETEQGQRQSVPQRTIVPNVERAVPALPSLPFGR